MVILICRILDMVGLVWYFRGDNVYRNETFCIPIFYHINCAICDYAVILIGYN
jgi:hypothetical protein